MADEYEEYTTGSWLQQFREYKFAVSPRPIVPSGDHETLSEMEAQKHTLKFQSRAEGRHLLGKPGDKETMDGVLVRMWTEPDSNRCPEDPAQVRPDLSENKQIAKS